MIRTVIIILCGIALLAIYKMQHVKPVDDPKDTPLFQQRLKSSLDRFQEGIYPARSDKSKTRLNKQSIPASSAYGGNTSGVVVYGRCGKVTMTWVEDGKVDKQGITVERKRGGGGYSKLEGKRIYEKGEEGGKVRYWISDSGLDNDVEYEYLVTLTDSEGKKVKRGPVSVRLTCTERDKEIIAQREKKLREYYQKKGIAVKDSKTSGVSQRALSTTGTTKLAIAGRCGKVTMTWVEDGRVDKQGITIERKRGGGKYSKLEGKRIYEKGEEGGKVRYWISDSGLDNDVEYEYLVTLTDSEGKKVKRGPVSVRLTCTERDKEIIAQREKRIKEFYREKGVKTQGTAAGSTASYRLSEEIYDVITGNSPQRGNSNAPITMVVFTDFECIHCSRWAQTLSNIQKMFPEDVRIIFKSYPLSYHTHSELAARAVFAAGEQGKFWEMYDVLFKNTTALGEGQIKEYAKTLGLDMEKFQEALVSKRIRKSIERDKAQGKMLEVKNVPTTFINGRKLVGAPPLSYLKNTISKILRDRGG